MVETHALQKTGLLINDKFYQLDWLPELVEIIADVALEKIKQESDRESRPVKDEFYTTREVAQMIRKSEATVTRHIRKGLMIGNKTGKTWLISKENYSKYINASNKFP